MTAAEEKLILLLHKLHQSITPGRRQMFNVLQQHGPLSMSDLIKYLPNVNRASIYRNVTLFESIGIINRLPVGWKYQLELSDLFSDHHHHITCIKCGNVEPFQEEESLEKKIADIGTTAGYLVESHSLEIRGVCPVCQLAR
ncbi:MAG: Fur family transcriptional regulator [Candidatus Saccharimonadales bacterium]